MLAKQQSNLSRWLWRICLPEGFDLKSKLGEILEKYPRIHKVTMDLIQPESEEHDLARGSFSGDFKLLLDYITCVVFDFQVEVRELSDFVLIDWKMNEVFLVPTLIRTLDSFF